MSVHAPLPAAPVDAVVCDDSGFMRRMLADALTGVGVRVVGTAANGQEALDLCARLRPDVLTLDLNMPGLGGLDVLRRLPPGGPGVIVVSAHTDDGSALAVEALSEGAAEVIRKPGLTTSPAQFRAELGTSVRAAAAARRAGARRSAPSALGRPGAHRAPAGSAAAPVRGPRRQAARSAGAPLGAGPTAVRTSAGRPLVVVACSTGGPRALATFVPQLPAPCGAGVLIVQHMPPGFTGSLAQRLDASSRLDVREARDGDAIEPGRALLAPGGLHLRVQGTRVRLTQEPPVGSLRPRADLTIEDAARDWPGRVVLVVLTGMGTDGLRGAQAVRRAGGVILTEAEETCVVYGMPRSVEEAGLADVVQPLGSLPAALRGVIR